MLAAATTGSGAISGAFDDHRVRQVERRCAGEDARLGEALGELDEDREGRVEALFHRAVEDKVAELVGGGLAGELAGRLRQSFRRGGWPRGSGRPAGTPVARRVEAEHRLLLLQQRDDLVVARSRRLGGDERAQRKHRDDGGGDECTHGPSVNGPVTRDNSK